MDPCRQPVEQDHCRVKSAPRCRAYQENAIRASMQRWLDHNRHGRSIGRGPERLELVDRVSGETGASKTMRLALRGLDTHDHDLQRRLSVKRGKSPRELELWKTQAFQPWQRSVPGPDQASNPRTGHGWSRSPFPQAWQQGAELEQEE